MIGNRPRLYLNSFFAIAFFIIVLFSRLAYYSVEAHLILLTVFILVGAVWIGALVKFPAVQSQAPLNLGWVAILIAIAISSAFSLNPAQSWRLAWSWAIAPVTFFLVYYLLQLKLFSVRYILHVCLAIFSVFLIAGYLEIWQITAVWLSTVKLLPFQVGLIHGWTESRNILALFLVWISVISFGQITQRSWLNLIWASLIVSSLLLIFLASSAGGIISLLTVAIVLLVGRSFSKIEQFWAWLKTWQVVLACLIAIFGALAGGKFLIGWLAVDPGFADRLAYWEIARGTFSQSPFSGMGLGTHITSFVLAPDFQLKHRLFFNPHSFWFTVLADIGLIGVAAVGVWGIQTTSLLAKRARTILTSTHGLILIACLSAFFVHSLIETPRPRLFLIATIFLACLIYETEPEITQAHKTLRSFWAWLWPVIFIGLGIGLWQSYRVQNLYELGIAEAEQGNWTHAADLFSQPSATGHLPETAVLTAAAYANGQLDLSHPATIANTADLEQLIQQEPAWPVNHLHLALLHEHNGDIAAAEASYRRAAEIAPDMPYMLLNLAQFYARLDEEQKAESVYEQLYGLPNTWHQAPFWNDITLDGQPIANKSQSCIDTTCFYFGREELKQAWELLAAGQDNAARALFEEIQTQEIYTGDPAIYLGHYLTSAEQTKQFSAEQGFQLASLTTPFFDPFVPQLFLLNELNEEFIQLRLERITAHSAQGFGLKSNGDYIRLGYLRSAMPYDLLPAVQCFTADDHIAWQLTQLENWYRTNGLETYAEMVNTARLGPNGNGVHSCINLDSSKQP